MYIPQVCEFVRDGVSPCVIFQTASKHSLTPSRLLGDNESLVKKCTLKKKDEYIYNKDKAGHSKEEIIVLLKFAVLVGKLTNKIDEFALFPTGACFYDNIVLTINYQTIKSGDK